MMTRCVRPGCDRPAAPRPHWLANFQLCDVHQAELDRLNGRPEAPPPPAEQRQLFEQPAPPRPRRRNDWPEAKWRR